MDTGEQLLKSLMIFVTGQPTMDPYDAIQVQFINASNKRLLEADACFNKVYLPLSHSTYEEFKRCCVTSLLYGGVGYGRF